MKRSVVNLDLKKLIQHCQEETTKFQADQSHDEQYCLELFYRAIRDNDQAAWEAIYVQYQALVATWVGQHPRFQGSQKEIPVFINAAFARFWRNIFSPEQKKHFDSLGKILHYLKQCLNSVIVDTYRQPRWSQEILQWDELSEELSDEEVRFEDRILNQVIQEALQWAVWRRLQGEVEIVVATLNWRDALSPAEIQKCHPDLFPDVQRVYRVKRNILERLLRDPEIQNLRKWML